MTFILAKIFGLYFFTLACAVLINPDRFKKIYRQMVQDESVLLMGGIIALLIGAVIVSVHNDWTLGWPLIITLLGWWSLLKGFILLTYPKFVKLFSFAQNKSTVFYRVISLIWMVIGLLFIYKGWQ